jgi:hypothetical protein
MDPCARAEINIHYIEGDTGRTMHGIEQRLPTYVSKTSSASHYIKAALRAPGLRKRAPARKNDTVGFLVLEKALSS